MSCSQHKFGIRIAIIRIHNTEFRPHFPFLSLLFTTNLFISYLGYNLELQNFWTRAKSTIVQLDSKIMLLNKKIIPGTPPQTRKKHRFFLSQPKIQTIIDLIHFGSRSLVKEFNKPVCGCLDISDQLSIRVRWGLQPH